MAERVHVSDESDSASKVWSSQFGIPSEIDLREILRTIWRRKFIFLGTVAIVTGLTIVMLLQVTELYTAEAVVMIDTQKAQFVQLEDVIPGLTGDSGTIETQIEILKSRSLARRTIDRLNLIEDGEFNPLRRPPKTGILSNFSPGKIRRALNPFRYLPESWRTAVLGAQDEPEMSKDEQLERQIEIVTDNFLSGLSVQPVGRSLIILLRYDSVSPRKAALIGNTIAELYLVEQLEAKYEATKRATTWLNERLTDLQEEVKSSESAVARYRQSVGLTGPEESTITDQQLSELNTQLVFAQAARAEAEARLRQVRALLDEPGAIESSPEVLDSPMMLGLKQQETELLRREAELANTYRAMHPVMINARAEHRDLRAKIEVETKRIVRGVANKVDVALARENALKESLEILRAEVAVLDRAGVKLRELEREANATRVLYETFLSRFKETSEQEQLQQPDARIVSRASMPTNPSYPKRTKVVVIVAVGSMFLGLLIIFTLESLDSSFRSAEQIERKSGVRVLGILPTIRGFSIRSKLFGRSVLNRANPAFLESVRTVNTALALSNDGVPVRTVLITSSVPSEGKTLLSTSLALQLARTGKRCLLMDCDFRRSRVHKMMGVANVEGISDVLVGARTFEEVIQIEDVSGLHFITAGSLEPLNSDQPAPGGTRDFLSTLFVSGHMKNFLADAASLYDAVIIDAPPAMVVADARALSPLVDATIYVIRWGKTRENVALGGLRRLAEGGARVLGVVLARVNTRQYAQYGFADAGMFTKEYNQYY